jgi:uncharacterized protein
MKYRRFGKTNFPMPVLSCGGMRYQQSWKTDDPVTVENQENLEACILRAYELGINHIETARGYGTSEAQLSKVLPKLPREKILLQTKVSPHKDVAKFKATFEKSMRLLGADYLDIFSFHGLNNAEILDETRVCMDTALQWKKEGRIRDIGFSTHGSCADIVSAIETDLFDHVNLHWYYFFQENWPAIEAATQRDMGVFIISPNDKGGLLYRPSEKLQELTAPLHPMVFNGLFCLARREVHTLSCGVSRPEDFDIHLQTVELIEDAEPHIRPIMNRLTEALEREFGETWARTWDENLPDWNETPGEINMRWILRLRNLAIAYDMIEYGKMRYNLLGNGGHWFPGEKAEKVDANALKSCLRDSPHRDRIPDYLVEAHAMLSGEERKRLQET